MFVSKQQNFEKMDSWINGLKFEKYINTFKYSRYGYLLKALDELIPNMYILLGFG